MATSMQCMLVLNSQSHIIPNALCRTNNPRARTQRIPVGTRVDSNAERGPLLVIHNHEGFTISLCQSLADLRCSFADYKDDEFNVDERIDEFKKMRPKGILIVSGPGTPGDAVYSKLSKQTVLKLGPTIPLLGVSLGHQCIAEAFGGKIVTSPIPVFPTKQDQIYHPEILHNIPNPVGAFRYHTLVIEEESFPNDELEKTAWTKDGLIMAIRHKKYKHIQGVQFHPESIVQDNKKKIWANFLSMALPP